MFDVLHVTALLFLKSLIAICHPPLHHPLYLEPANGSDLLLMRLNHVVVAACAAYQRAIAEKKVDPLLIMGGECLARIGDGLADLFKLPADLLNLSEGRVGGGSLGFQGL